MATNNTRTSDKRAATTEAASSAKAIFHSIGAAFIKGDDIDVQLETSFLDALGFETSEDRRYSLHIKQRTSKSGKVEYKSIFLCDAPKDNR